MSQPRRWRHVFWLFMFILHLVALGFVLCLLGMNRFGRPDRLNIDRFTNVTANPNSSGIELTETFWSLYGAAGGVGSFLAWAWRALMRSRAEQMMRVAIHGLTTYLAVISVLCFWENYFFWGVALAIGAALHFLYVMSVLDRIPFTMLVLQKAVKMVWNLPEVVRVAYVFLGIMLSWMVVWSFGVSGVVALNWDDGARRWLLVVLSNPSSTTTAPSAEVDGSRRIDSTAPSS